MGFDFSKASQSFDKLSFKKRMTSVFHLFSNTFTVIGRNNDIKTPLVRMLVYNFVMITAFFYFIFNFWYSLPLGFLAFLIAFILFVYKYFYYSRQEVRMSWIVYGAITGDEPNYKQSIGITKQLKPQVRKIGWIDIGMALIGKTRYIGRGTVNTLIKLFLAGLNEVWDLINHYLLPSVAIDKLDIKPAVERMKRLKDQVPETLVGVFGIDFIGKVVSKVVFPVYIVLIILSLVAGYFFSDYLPSFEIDFENVLPEGSQFSLIPLVLAIFIGKLFSSFFERMVTTVKIIYFTIFYTKITHPERIAPDLQEQLVDYLRLDQVDEVKNLDEQGSEPKS